MDDKSPEDRLAMITLIVLRRRRDPRVAHLAIHHIDGNPRNNDLSNLQVVSLKANRDA